MPLFTNKFHPRKASPRKSQAVSTLRKGLGRRESEHEFGADVNGPIRLGLGELDGIFEDGHWLVGNPSHVQETANDQGTTKLKKQNQIIEKENSLLKLQVEILLDMLAEVTMETQMQAKEIQQLKQTWKTNKFHS